MRQLLVALIFVIALCSSAPVRARPAATAHAAIQQRSSACGPDAPDGLILHQAFAADGKLADPPLALLNPTTGASRPVDVPEPRDWFPAGLGCNAVVKTATGAWYLVFGRTSEPMLLDFLKPEDGWKLDEYAYRDTGGERRFGLFTTSSIAGNQAVLVDFEQGAYWDLTLLLGERGTFTFSMFSPSGNYLIIHAGLTWLIPTRDPTSARGIAYPVSSVVQGFDAAEERIIYWSLDVDPDQQLIVEEIETEKTYVVATAALENGDDQFLSGWFIPGDDKLVAVWHADHFAVVDISSPEPVEQFVLEGEPPFSYFVAAPSGLWGIVEGKGETTLVDIRTGELHVVSTDDESAISAIAAHGRWGFALLGSVDEPRGIGVIDLETGEFRTIDMFDEGETLESGETVWSRDGKIGLVVIADASRKRHLSLIKNPRGTIEPIADADSISVSLSPDATWAVFSTTERTDAGPVREMSLLETKTAAVTSLGPGLDPVWLDP